MLSSENYYSTYFREPQKYQNFQNEPVLNLGIFGWSYSILGADHQIASLAFPLMTRIFVNPLFEWDYEIESK